MLLSHKAALQAKRCGLAWEGLRMMLTSPVSWAPITCSVQVGVNSLALGTGNLQGLLLALSLYHLSQADIKAPVTFGGWINLSYIMVKMI